jgi:hypothetical protein
MLAQVLLFAPVLKQRGVVVLAAMMVLAMAASLLFLRFGGNVTGFFRIGDALPLSPFLPRSEAFVHPGETGYDGQLFLTLAYDPLLRHEGTAAALDNPRYRARRILYPALAHGLALGSPRAVPWALVLLNVASATALVALLAFGGLRETPGWALGVLAFQGLWVCLAMSTADLFALLFLVAALGFHQSRNTRNPAGIVVSLLLASLARETYLLHGALFAGLALRERRWREALAIAAGQLPAAAWNAWVLLRVPQGSTSVRESFGLPFGGILEAALRLLRGDLTGKLLYEGLSLALLLSVAALVTWALLERGGTAAWCAVPFLLLLALSRVILVNYYVHYTRVYLGLCVLLLLCDGGVWFRRLRAGFLGASAVASALYLGRQLFF